MEIDQDSVPSTIAAAVDALVSGISDEDRSVIVETDAADARAHHSIGRYLRNNWSLWDPESPLKRDAIATYGIAHADDISGLIMAWAVARVRGEEFDALSHVQTYHDHWARYGTTSLKAGGA